MIRFNIDFLLEKKERSRKWLIEKTGLSKNTVGPIYNNKTKRIDMDTLSKLCEALDCEPGDIIKKEAEK